MANPLSNTITYTISTKSGGDVVLHLRLTGPWVRSLGVQPDINVAIVSASEFDLLNKEPLPIVGTVRFWYSSFPSSSGANSSGPPDATLAGIRIVDLQPEIPGQVIPKVLPKDFDIDNVPVGIVNYKVSFSDCREKFAAPFGGRMRNGEINKLPLDKTGAMDANGNEVLNPQRVARLCLRAMGLPQALGVNSLSDEMPPYNLECRGNRGTDVLEQVLKTANHAMTVDKAGQLAIVARGKGTAPAVPASLLAASPTYRSFERRGAAVILSSAPNAITDTVAIYGPDSARNSEAGGSGDQQSQTNWEFVIQDAAGKWDTIENVFAALGLDPMEQLQTSLDDCPPAMQKVWWGQLYKCIRLNADIWGPQPINKYVWTGDNTDKLAVIVEAKFANFSIKGDYLPIADYQQCNVLAYYEDGTIIHVAERLVRCGGNVLGAIEADPRPLEDDDLKITCSREVYEQIDTGWVPVYYEIGYKYVDGSLTPVTGDALQNLIDSAEAPVMAAPMLRLYRIEGVDQNAAKLQDQAGVIGDAYLRGSGQPAQLMIVRGFYDAALNGVTHKISLEQEPPRTTIEVNTFYLPHSEQHQPTIDNSSAGSGRGGSSGEKYPKQNFSAGERAAAGNSGYTQPAAIIRAQPPADKPFDSVVVFITNSAPGNGKYYGHWIAGTPIYSDKTALQMPEGQTQQDGQILIENLSEDKTQIGSGGGNGHLLPLNQYYVGKVVSDAAGKAIVQIDCERCGLMDKVGQKIDPTGSGADSTSVEAAERKAVDITIAMRQAWDSGGEQVVQFVRVFSIRCGQITNISSEQKRVVLTTASVDVVTGVECGDDGSLATTTDSVTVILSGGG